ncbi:hypothetical protein DYU05_09755 [Mucilaginibacter terrenus]|uniref:Uncharacterized protein n=1 Tax=Mucilaginibacter terrenus TaxID=2482727 RepID=A0A3E2NY56_9SPHI|nr:hypothetical protein [Mucilaginibacter terrenus]RFZ85851.1 hypothetical protein DYU05_09755 [Mucilaginibacter terrenus]
MKQQEVFKKIGGIIQEINDQYQYLQGSENNMNDLELELFVANTHFLKDHAEILRKLNAIKTPATTASIGNEPKWFEPVVQPAKPQLPPNTTFKLDAPAAPKEEDHIRYEIGQPEEPSPTVEFTPVNKVANELTQAADEPVADSIDLGAATPDDTYSFEREEPEIIKHQLILDDEQATDEVSSPEDEALLTPITYVDEPEPEEVETIDLPVVDVAEPEPVIEDAAEEPLTETLLLPEVNKAETKPFSASMEEIQAEHFSNQENQRVSQAELPKEETDLKEEQILTLNQRLSAQLKDKSHNISAATPKEVVEPLADIKAAITLNDKLLFVKDLFKGYNLAYTEAIEIVNRFTNYEEAERFLKNNYVTKNDWESKPATAEKFYALLRRRYAKS